MSAPAPPNKNSGKTQATIVYDQIRKDILTGALKPGEPLRVERLREKYETSGSPVREALNRLSANGLVGSEDNRGFNVPEISREELKELYKTRFWIEEIALRESIAHGDESWEEAIVLALHRLTRSPRCSENPTESNLEWEARHREFHMALISGCNSRFMTRFCQQLHDQSDRYRQIAATIAPKRKSDKEHTDLFNAAVNRDAEEAVRLLKEHYVLTQEILCKGKLE